jgi:hypothetical protein
MTEFTVILVVVGINFIVSLFVGNFIFKRYLDIVERLDDLNKTIEDIADKIYEVYPDNVKIEPVETVKIHETYSDAKIAQAETGVKNEV